MKERRANSYGKPFTFKSDWVEFTCLVGMFSCMLGMCWAIVQIAFMLLGD